MQNNLNNTVFNPNDSNTWRWNDPALANTIVSEAEARQIRQIAPQLGDVFTLLHTGDSGILPSIIDHNLNETQPLLARRAAIVITAQQTYGIPIRNEQQAIDAHRQIDNFFGGFDDNMQLHPRQADLIHKTIDSRFAAREFLRGRNLLDSNVPKGNYPNRANVITEAALVHFFKDIVEDIPDNLAQNRHDYLRVDLQAPLQNNDGTYVFIRHAFEYLVRMYKGIGKGNAAILTLLNRLINNTAVTGAIKNAIIREISATKLGASLRHLQGITDEEAVRYINFLSRLVNGIGKTITNEILNDQGNVLTILEASKTDINIENLCHAIIMVREAANELNNVNSTIHYIQFIVNLINAPESQAVNGECLNNLLDFQEGALALNSARSRNIEPNTLAQSLHIAITDANNPAHSKKKQAAYMNLMTEAVSRYISTANPNLQIVQRRVIQNILCPYIAPMSPADFIRELFNNAAMSILLNRARVIGLNANAIACILSRRREIEGSLLLLGFVLDIIDLNIQNINVQLMNNFINNQNGATDTLHKARNAHLNASSVARLMSCGNNHNNRIADLRVVIDLIEPQNQAAIRLEADAVNRYLALDGSPENIQAYRVQKMSSEAITNIIRPIIDVNVQLEQERRQAQQQIDAVMQERVATVLGMPATNIRIIVLNTYPPEVREQVIARLPEDIRNPILASLNQQNAA